MKKLALSSALAVVAVISVVLGQTSAPGWAGAQWVWDQPDANQITQTDAPRYLRRVFELPAQVAKAELWITVDNKYTVYVNGQKVGEDSEWNTVERYDVAKHLVPGKNVLAIIAQNQGGVAGAIARLHVQTADKKDHFIVTDEKMKITQTAAKDWLKPDFDDSAWFPAIVLGDAGIGPWNLESSVVAQGGDKKSGKGYGTNAVDPKIKKTQSAYEELKHFVVPEGFTVELVAADPVVINPITMAMDDKGRIYVSESHTYRYGPSGSPIKPYANPVVRLDPTPDGKGLKRTLVADGFADPVMGIAIKGDKLWLTACNFLYRYDLVASPPSPKEGIAINKKTILIDKNKAWNPFGMFVLEWGLDGLLYMSVGDHRIDIHGPDGKISGRGNSGIIMRMNPDGTKMQRLTHGFRVPYSFEYDPYGQLWLLSNGEGNPDRFARILEGVDYHCYSRAVDNNWLAGRNPLAPPVFELHRGAHTQLMRYYGANFPAEYQGSLFLDNWGAHGFANINRGIFRFVPDEHNNIVQREPLISCTDPHFRPSHILLDQDGSLLINDWYGRDDESDLTGRIWRLKYVGKNSPVVTHKLDSAEWATDEYAISALGSPSHVIRAKAVDELIKRGPKVVGKLAEYAGSAKEPLGAAHALWTLLRIGTPESKSAIAMGAKHTDWKVRRLAVNIARRYELPDAAAVAKLLGQDKEPAVQVEAALAQPTSDAIRSALITALKNGAAGDEHLRYEAAWHLAKNAGADGLSQVLFADDADVRLAGLIAIDVACYEDFPTKKIALEALAKALETPGKADQMLLLTLAQMHGDPSIIKGLEKMVAREDLPIAVTAKAILVLKAKSPGGLSKTLGAAAGKRLVEAVEKGAFRIATPTDQLTLFEFLESEGPTPFALKQIAGSLRSNQPALREQAHVLARKFGPRGSPLANDIWTTVLAPKANFTDSVELISTLARIEEKPRTDAWQKLLTSGDPFIRAEAVRWWRNFKDNSEMVEVLVRQAPELIKSDDAVKEDLGSVLRQLHKTDASKALHLPEQEKDKDALTKYALAELANMPAPMKQKRAQLGMQVFERGACTKCHTTATQTTPLAPSLKGVAAQKIEYLVESVLYPSKIIKTGFESETVVLANGKVVSGLVKDDGKFLRVLNLDVDTKIAKSDVESRSVSRISIMPEGQEAQLSRREFVDLIAYLATLR